MKKYTIAIEELSVKEFMVFADDSEAAMKIAEDKYKKCEFILDPGEVQLVQMSIINPSNEMVE